MWLKLKVKAEDRWQRKKNPSLPSTATNAHTPKTLSETHASVGLKVIGYAHVTGTEGYVDVMLKNNLYTIMKSLKKSNSNIMNNETIKGYKGFNPDLTCRDFQYEVGKEYETDKAVVCNAGFHFCENPFDVLGFYAPSSEKGMNRFCEVEGNGEFDKSENDKVSCTRIHIGAEIGLNGLIKAGVKFILDKVKWDNDKESNTGDRSAATNTGDQSAATNTGDRSAATNTGDRSAATNTGDQSAATNTGDQSAATNTGDRSAATVEGEESVAIVTGVEGKAAGALGCWIVLTERGEWNGKTYPIKEVRAFKVDDEKIKADTFYMLVDGEAKEVK